MNDISLSESKNPSDDEFPGFIERRTENYGGSNPTPGANTFMIQVVQRLHWINRGILETLPS